MISGDWGGVPLIGIGDFHAPTRDLLHRAVLGDPELLGGGLLPAIGSVRVVILGEFGIVAQVVGSAVRGEVDEGDQTVHRVVGVLVEDAVRFGDLGQVALEVVVVIDGLAGIRGRRSLPLFALSQNRYSREIYTNSFSWLIACCEVD